MDSEWIQWKKNPQSEEFENLWNFIQKLLILDNDEILLEFIKLHRTEIIQLRNWTGGTILHELMRFPNEKIIQCFLTPINNLIPMIHLYNVIGNTPLHFLTLQLRNIQYFEEEMKKQEKDRQISLDIQLLLKDCLSNPDINITKIFNNRGETPYDYLSPDLKLYYNNKFNK